MTALKMYVKCIGCGDFIELTPEYEDVEDNDCPKLCIIFFEAWCEKCNTILRTDFKYYDTYDIGIIGLDLDLVI